MTNIGLKSANIKSRLLAFESCVTDVTSPINNSGLKDKPNTKTAYNSTNAINTEPEKPITSISLL
ncbi:hypothetical protein D3C87_1821610 [compost metagenome]